MMRVWGWMAAIWMALAGVVAAEERPLIVVELFTSQGCSSCPPADAFLHELAKRDDVLALSLHVDYWDYIGWKDVFAQPKFTKRQHSYAHVGGRRSVYTPQMVIQGQDHVVGNHPMDVTELIRLHQERGVEVALVAQRNGGQVTIRADARKPGKMLVQLVQYAPQEKVKIKRGENAGHTLSYANVARDWTQLGQWDGRAPLEMTAKLTGNLPAAVIVQRIENRGFGAIAAAARVK
ncbi:DUF1223 domain-containing protein [Marimonas lutisalis]|uniref:DUF1223 domain-containing protein n=1 Tax=Marimonas lutisalis TaxID=2545756 RepID=UPI0010F4FB26|nr:DUF1223 domain-containing protein [Marimonas lutisalis]